MFMYEQQYKALPLAASQPAYWIQVSWDDQMNEYFGVKDRDPWYDSQSWFTDASKRGISKVMICPSDSLPRSATDNNGTQLTNAQMASRSYGMVYGHWDIWHQGEGQGWYSEIAAPGAGQCPNYGKGGPVYQKLSSMRNSAGTYLMSERVTPGAIRGAWEGAYVLTPMDQLNTPSTRMLHGTSRSLNFLFCDGHVEFRPITQDAGADLNSPTGPWTRAAND